MRSPVNHMTRESRICLIVGLAASAASIAGLMLEPTRFLRSYLFSFLFWVDLPLGALPMIMTYHLTGGTWGAATRRIMEALAGSLGWIAPFVLPILIGMRWLYPWLDPKTALDPLIAHKHLYLNAASFCARTVFYFICWLALAHFLQRGSESERKGAPIEINAKIRSLSAGGLVLYALTSTFAGIDWQMSVEPTWASTIYGLVYSAGQVMGSFALMGLVFAWKARKQGLSRLFPRKTLLDIGNILLAIVMVWTYLSFMQYLVVWSGNLPREVLWFDHRNAGSWRGVSYLLGAFEFTAPFTLLLFRGVKDRVAGLACVCGLLFAVRIVDHYWMVMPGFMPDGVHLHWLDAATFLAIGGLWLAAFLNRLEKRPIFATLDRDWPVPGQDGNATQYDEVPSHA